MIAAQNVSLTLFVAPQNSKPNFFQHTEKKVQPLFIQLIRTNHCDPQCLRLEKLNLLVKKRVNTLVC